MFFSAPFKKFKCSWRCRLFTTNSKKLYDLATDLKNHGMTNRNIVKNFGYVSRMDNLQAAVLDYRLKNLPSIIKQRRKNANLYFK